MAVAGCVGKKNQKRRQDATRARRSAIAKYLSFHMGMDFLFLMRHLITTCMLKLLLASNVNFRQILTLNAKN